MLLQSHIHTHTHSKYEYPLLALYPAAARFVHLFSRTFVPLFIQSFIQLLSCNRSGSQSQQACEVSLSVSQSVIHSFNVVGFCSFQYVKVNVK